MKKYLFKASMLLVIFILMSCGSSNVQRSMTPVLRPAVDAPLMFETPEGISVKENTCNSPLIDPRDDSRIIMITSFNEGVADYEVPEGKYGVEDRELLRVNCATGEVVGIVRR
ncbi:hypothetical protein [Salinimicrobium xinjiangense]|uniref:hypothetical protein n=1 Tax=Salinimicrobium xinjiangense TaxID=438596 RepID=UPI00040AA5C2|nr:hypothetical protein [Salinimicrobium xinjiangense]